MNETDEYKSEDIIIQPHDFIFEPYRSGAEHVMESLRVDGNETEYRDRKRAQRSGVSGGSVNPYPAKVIYLNLRPLDVVSRYLDPQPQVVENYSYLLNLRPNIYKF